MGKETFEHLLGFHGAPTLVGVKPATLLSFHKKSYEDFDALLASYAPCFRCKGISVRRVVEDETHVLLLFYRARRLSRLLKRPAAKALLAELGYDAEARLSALLAELVRRMEAGGGFPHEIGLFLGYPPGDVRGFIENHGKNFAFVGYWKVYGSEAEARELFAVYAECTQEFCEQLDAGARFEDLVVAG